jgi:hypothetical protein
VFGQIVAIPIGINCAPIISYTVINFNLNSIFVRVLLTYLDMNSLEIIYILISRRLSELSPLFYRMYELRLCQCLLRRQAPFIKPEVWGHFLLLCRYIKHHIHHSYHQFYTAALVKIDTCLSYIYMPSPYTHFCP